MSFNFNNYFCNLFEIALASILEAARKRKENNLDPYLTQVLIPEESMLPPVIEAVRSKCCK